MTAFPNKPIDPLSLRFAWNVPTMLFGHFAKNGDSQTKHMVYHCRKHLLEGARIKIVLGNFTSRDQTDEEVMVSLEQNNLRHSQGFKTNFDIFRDFDPIVRDLRDREVHTKAKCRSCRKAEKHRARREAQRINGRVRVLRHP